MSRTRSPGSLTLVRCFPVVLVFDEVLGAPFGFLIVELHVPNRENKTSVSRWEESKEGGAGRRRVRDSPRRNLLYQIP